jgi:hypothetical protein
MHPTLGVQKGGVGVVRFDPEAHVRELQAEIDAALADLNPGWIQSIALWKGSDVVDLRSNAGIEVTPIGGDSRDFDVRSADCMAKLCAEHPWHLLAPSLGGRPTDILGSYGPLIVLSRITGDAIVRGMLQFVEREVSEGAVRWIPEQGTRDDA